MNITASVDFNFRFGERLRAAAPKAALDVANEIMKDTSPYVPFLTGALDRSAHVQQRGNGAVIIYGGGGIRYARYLYHGMLMVDPVTGSPWARRGVKKVLTAKPLKFNKSGHPKATSKWFEASKLQNMDKWTEYARKAMVKYAEE